MDFEVVIVGGGPAGSAAGLTLARSGHRVCLIERQPAPFRIGESLPSGARPLLADLGLLDSFLREGHRDYLGNISQWGSSETRHLDFLLDPQGRGWHLDRSKFDEYLRWQARQFGCVVWENSTCDEITTGESGDIYLETAGYNEGTICCGFVIDATGRAAWIGRRQGAVRIRDDRLLSTFATFRSAAANDDFAYTLCESTAEGWWYSSRIPSGQRVVAFHTDADLPQASRVRMPDVFLQSLRSTSLVWKQMANCGYEVEGPPIVVPAESSRLAPIRGKRWLATGDAACAFDPISSQGILNALFTGMRAGEAVRDWLAGKTSALDEYESDVATIYERYQVHRLQFYRAERRWPHDLFWSRRHGEG